VRSIRETLGRPTLPLLVLVALVVAGCAQVGTASLTFWDLVWTIVVLFFWMMALWVFIALFGDIFRRNDLSGVMKAVWIFVLFVLPFLGALIYIITRPKMTAQDVEMLTQAQAAQKAASAVTPVDQIATLNQLKASGAITEPEYEALKKKAIEG
jgi:predicted membrane channel-forming protein YqfA (hemolysin III family)